MMFKKPTQIMAISLMLSLVVTLLIPGSVFAAPGQQDALCAQDYVIQAGDSLSALAEEQYGDALAFPQIVEATHEARSSDESYAAITDPSLLEVGWKVCLTNSDEMQANTETMSDSEIMTPEAQIRAASGAWDEAFNVANLDQLMALYSENAVSMPPGLPALEGKSEIEADFQWVFDNFTAEHKTTIVGLETSGDLAVERGQYTMMFTPKDGSDPFSESGKHIVVRQKSGDDWLVLWEIWNMNE